MTARRSAHKGAGRPGTLDLRFAPEKPGVPGSAIARCDTFEEAMRLARAQSLAMDREVEIRLVAADGRPLPAPEVLLRARKGKQPLVAVSHRASVFLYGRCPVAGKH